MGWDEERILWIALLVPNIVVISYPEISSMKMQASDGHTRKRCPCYRGEGPSLVARVCENKSQSTRVIKLVREKRKKRNYVE
jgi:hypothetical protein